ncbi:MAG: zf-TFIIB domain-containing protein [Lewinella sp.]|uniref:zf-TFIIB domain-containing protein n=1 Tax=Lewinella sp. TaxID=2004506 RepID=UPI003D6BABD6
MNCPRCKVSMQLETIKEKNYQLEIDRCPQCDGIWLDFEEMKKLESIVEPVAWEVRQIPPQVDQLIGLYCPRCPDSPLLIKADHPRDRHVIIDYCKKCQGTWLDPGELTAIQQEHFLISLYHFIRDLGH